jgi:hypothetical protein
MILFTANKTLKVANYQQINYRKQCAIRSKETLGMACKYVLLRFSTINKIHNERNDDAQ